MRNKLSALLKLRDDVEQRLQGHHKNVINATPVMHVRSVDYSDKHSNDRNGYNNEHEMIAPHVSHPLSFAISRANKAEMSQSRPQLQKPQRGNAARITPASHRIHIAAHVITKKN
uniref:Uncharacterized protein n=1 Tax=Lygus hesperus TaxID=30085 RepID=A0A146KLW1_LYGHE